MSDGVRLELDLDQVEDYDDRLVAGPFAPIAFPRGVATCSNGTDVGYLCDSCEARPILRGPDQGRGAAAIVARYLGIWFWCAQPMDRARQAGSLEEARRLSDAELRAGGWTLL